MYKLVFLLAAAVLATTSASGRIRLYTKGNDPQLNYQFFPLIHDYLEFNVRATQDVKILLASTHALQEPYYEIVIGCFGNTKSIIRKNQRVFAYERNGPIITPNEFQKFWVKINDTEGRIQVGKGSNGAFLDYRDPNYYKMTTLGVTTNSNAEGHWEFSTDMIVPSSDCIFDLVRVT